MILNFSYPIEELMMCASGSVSAGQDLFSVFKYPEAFDLDLEPLPLFSPVCLDTLRAVDPNLFEPSHVEEECIIEPTPFAKDACAWNGAETTTTTMTMTISETEESLLETPSTFDVICSRAKQFYQLPGCERFRQIIRGAIPTYMQAGTRLEKSLVIANTIEKVIHHPDVGHIRFWKYDSASKRWCPMGSDQIRDKVSHALREMILEVKRAFRKHSM